MENDNKLGWFLAGAAVGAAIALLYAPKSGKDTRRFLAHATREGADAVGAGGREILDRGKDLYDQGKKVAEDAASLFERGRKLVQG